MDIVQEVASVETPIVGYDIKIEGLTEEEAVALQEKVKSAVVVVLPERFRYEQILVAPKVTEEAG